MEDAHACMILTPHAKRRLAQRKIKPGYVSYTLKNGDRDEHMRDYAGMEAWKKQWCNLVVVYAARVNTQDVYMVLTAYWRENWREGVPEQHLFYTPKWIRYRKNGSWRQKRNLSWSFWADPECEVS
tara:strand:- start:363 stop:740 length:378 start_codon:yes stop_codon:yes gene_type:complete